MDKNQTPEEKKDIMDMFTPDMAKAADMLAYMFLKERGFDTSRCEQQDRKGASARKRLTKELEDKGLQLVYHLPTIENKIFCYFTLERIRDGKKMASSRTIEFDCQVVNYKPNEGGDGNSEM